MSKTCRQNRNAQINVPVIKIDYLSPVSYEHAIAINFIQQLPKNPVKFTQIQKAVVLTMTILTAFGLGCLIGSSLAQEIIVPTVPVSVETIEVPDVVLPKKNKEALLPEELQKLIVGVVILLLTGHRF